MHRTVFFATIVLSSGCSALLPLGDEYRFGSDGGIDAGSVDAGPILDGGIDAGSGCLGPDDCMVRSNTSHQCVDRACVYECETDFADCDGDGSNGCEQSVASNLANCGGCGNACTWACAGSTCEDPEHIYAGQNHTCVLLTTGRVACWGWNGFGQLGDGTLMNRTRPVFVDGLEAVQDIAAAAQDTCALRSDGTVLCWGDGRVDGIPGSADVLAPTLVPGVRDVVEIESDADGVHTCARHVTGEITCWGSDFYGQIGDGPTVSSDVPAQVSSIVDAAQLALGGSHSCALRETGRVWCWGANSLRELGDGTTTGRDDPVQVLGLSQVGAVSVGAVHNCSRRMFSDAITCWGDNSVGQLGDGTTAPRAGLYAHTGLPRVTAFSLGGGHTCVLTGAGQLLCWGWNREGQLGDDTTFDRPTPGAVTGLSGVAEVAAGGNHTCARLAVGSVYCWGRNDLGQVGDGTMERRTLPVLVPPPAP